MTKFLVTIDVIEFAAMMYDNDKQRALKTGLMWVVAFLFGMLAQQLLRMWS